MKERVISIIIAFSIIFTLEIITEINFKSFIIGMLFPFVVVILEAFIKGLMK